MARRPSPQMITVLKAMDEYSGTLHHGGLNSGELEFLGVSRGVLYTAVKNGWARQYGFRQQNDSAAPMYYRTPEGTKVLNDNSND